MDPEKRIENAPNYEDVDEITVIDEHTISFRLALPMSFLDYMTMRFCRAFLQEDMQESAFFPQSHRHRHINWKAGVGRRSHWLRNEAYLR